MIDGTTRPRLQGKIPFRLDDNNVNRCFVRHAIRGYPFVSSLNNLISCRCTTQKCTTFFENIVAHKFYFLMVSCWWSPTEDSNNVQTLHFISASPTTLMSEGRNASQFPVSRWEVVQLPKSQSISHRPI